MNKSSRLLQKNKNSEQRSSFPNLLFKKMDFSRHGLLLLFLCLIFGIGIGVLTEWGFQKKKTDAAVFGFEKIRAANNPYTFINPLIGFDSLEKKTGEYGVLEQKITKLIDSPDVKQKIKNISVYFRSVETGQWMGINENEEFHPASLLKVPIMMAYFKAAESSANILKRTYAYTDDDAKLLEQAYGIDLTPHLKMNHLYTIEELIREMIIHSDNAAKYLLILHGSQNDLDDVYGDLGVQIKDNKYGITTKTYSLFFRTLYNATFLSRDMSERAMKLLAETDYKNGLIADLPADLKVVHKFGSYAEFQDKKVASVELHDCGIIYYPGNPYLLCIMTRGYDTTQLESIVKDISKLVYESVKNHK